MRRFTFVLLLVGLVPFCGCAFNRSDFVSGPDGTPKEPLSAVGRGWGEFWGDLLNSIAESSAEGWKSP